MKAPNRYHLPLSDLWAVHMGQWRYITTHCRLTDGGECSSSNTGRCKLGGGWQDTTGALDDVRKRITCLT